MRGTQSLANGTVQVACVISSDSVDQVTTNTFKHIYFKYKNLWLHLAVKPRIYYNTQCKLPPQLHMIAYYVICEKSTFTITL
jgi:hypothetical protein